MTLRDDLARVVAERRAANPRNEPGHVDYGIADAVLSFVDEARVAERERVTRIIREQRDTLQATAAEFHRSGLNGLARTVRRGVEALDELLVALGVEEREEHQLEEQKRSEGGERMKRPESIRTPKPAYRPMSETNEIATRRTDV